MTPSSFIRTLAPALGSALLVRSLPAAETMFHPSVTLDAAWSDNVAYAGAADEPTSDATARLGVVLPLRTEWASGTWSFEYNPSYEKHQDLEVLDHAEHRLATHLSKKTGRTGVFGVGATFTRTQEQGRAWSLESPDLFLTNRTNRDLISADIGFAQEISPRWRWNAGVWGGWYDYAIIEGFDQGIPQAAVEDRNEYRGSVAVSRLMTRASSMGLQFEHRRFDLETGGTEDADLASITFDHAASRELTMSVQVGAFTRSTEGTVANPLEESPETGAQGGFSLRRTFTAAILTVDAGMAPTSGGALEGTSTDSSVGFTVASVAGLRWSWTASARYAYRDPTDPAEDPVNSIGGGAGLEWRPYETLGLRVAATYADQSGDAQGAALDASYTTVGAGLVWYPRGYPRESTGVNPREPSRTPQETPGESPRGGNP